MEEIGDIIGKGFTIWRNNLNLCVPFLLSSFLSLLLMIPLFFAIAYVIVPVTGINFTSLQQMQDQILKSEESLGNMTPGLIIQVTFLFILMIVLLSLVSAFFTAGAIGMARQALEKSKSDRYAMWSAANKHYWKMFLATIIMGFIMAIGLIFLLPALAMQPLSLQPEPKAMGLLMIGLFMLILYALALSMMLAIAPYALVVDDLDPWQAILASINFFRYNKFDVLILWLVVVAISISLQMIGGLSKPENAMANQTISLVTGLANILVLAPLSNLWWTRLYMDRKGILRADEVKDNW